MLLRLAGAAVLALALPVAPPSISITQAARAVQPGELVVLTATSSAAVAALRAHAFGRPLQPFKLDERTWRVLVGIDLDAEPGAHRVTIEADTPDGPVEAIHELTVTPKSFRTRRLTVAEGYVNPPAATLRRIEDDAARLEQIWTGSSAERLWTSAFVRPVPQRANSAFGTRSILNGQPRSPHGGADFASPSGTPIKAPAGGRVVLADDLYYTGGTVAIDHGVGLVSLFAHLSRIDVEAGDTVAAGTVVGLVGATGRVTGAHLHWTVRAAGARIDPLSLLAVLGE
jgi:murein DD-endopeptidase MepM/ murein hydrolase activator NlpD